mmetsp:Transcript_39333/g.94646  ORF Transcript_39333/g.94646 Transcript_39333/m.94646 type:complete len:217 (+) Transcript_39333:1657-2307(+)
MLGAALAVLPSSLLVLIRRWRSVLLRSLRSILRLSLLSMRSSSSQSSLSMLGSPGRWEPVTVGGRGDSMMEWYGLASIPLPLFEEDKPPMLPPIRPLATPLPMPPAMPGTTSFGTLDSAWPFNPQLGRAADMRMLVRSFSSAYLLRNSASAAETVLVRREVVEPLEWTEPLDWKLPLPDPCRRCFEFGMLLNLGLLLGLLLGLTPWLRSAVCCPRN